MASIQGIYIALFGRPADPLGLDYFNSITDNGQDLSQIQSLAGQPEYLSRFEGQNNAQIVTSIYQELFGRNPDAAGLAFFTAQLNSGAQNINTIAINILDGAQGADADLVEAKIAAADQFTDAVRADPDALAAYQGQSGINFGQAFLDQITTGDTALTDEQVADQVESFGNGDTEIPGIPGTSGNILTLTTDADVVSTDATSLQFRSSANNDTIRALDLGTLSSSDVVDGGAGFDVLNIADGAIAGGTATPVIRSVERINNSDVGSTLNLSATSGLEQLWSNAAAAGNAFTYTNASLATVFGTSGSTAAHTINVDFAGSLAGDTTVHLATTNAAGANATFDFGTDATGIEGVSIDASAGAGTVTIDADVTQLETITVTGEGRVTVVSAETTIETFDASGNTGGVVWTSGAIASDDAVVTGGSGNDVFNLGASTGDLTVNAGAGSDQITLGTGDNTVNLGAGNDIVTLVAAGGENTITLGAGNDNVVFNALTSSTYTQAEDSFSTITDFGDTDVLDFSAIDANNGTLGDQAFTLLGAQGQIDVQNALAGQTTLADAVAAVAGVVNTGELTSFTFDGNTYVYGENGAGNVFVELTGNVELTNSDYVL